MRPGGRHKLDRLQANQDLMMLAFMPLLRSLVWFLPFCFYKHGAPPELGTKNLAMHPSNLTTSGHDVGQTKYLATRDPSSDANFYWDRNRRNQTPARVGRRERQNHRAA